MKNCASPMVSVIIPSFNHQNYIKTAILSVLNQSFGNYEILISDDASSDESWKIISSFRDKRITSFKFDINMGAAENVNFLIKKASGKYIALLNSDDYWHKNKLELQYEFMEKNPSYAACFTDVIFVDENDKIIKRNIYLWDDTFKNSNTDRGKWLERLFFNLNSLCHPSIMIKREIYELAGLYNPCLVQLPDYNMWIKILKLAPIYFIDERLTFFRITPGHKNTSSICYYNIQRHNLELELILDNFFDDMPNEVFVQGFSRYFKRRGNLSELEIKCEKAFIYFEVGSKHKNIYRAVGIKKMYQLLADKEMIKILERSYGFSFKDFRELKNGREFWLEKFVVNIKLFIRKSSFINFMIYKIKRRKEL